MQINVHNDNQNLWKMCISNKQNSFKTNFQKLNQRTNIQKASG